MAGRFFDYASFDAASIAFRACFGLERVDFYTGATGNSFCCALEVETLLSAEGDLEVGRLHLHNWQVRDLKIRLAEIHRLQARRLRPSALAG